MLMWWIMPLLLGLREAQNRVLREAWVVRGAGLEKLLETDDKAITFFSSRDPRTLAYG
jgi:hypothetical protein